MSSVCLPTREITLLPGSCVTLNDVRWAQYLELLVNRGEQSTPRIYFGRGSKLGNTQTEFLRQISSVGVGFGPSRSVDRILDI